MLYSVQTIKQWIKNPSNLFVVLFLVLIGARIVDILRPATLWWDASVYIGMARYLSSFGANGLWEFFRPPLLPIIFSVGGFLHIGLIFWAKLVTFFFAAGSLVLLYRIGERIRPFVGVCASFILGIASLFVSFTTVPMTEISGIFFSLVALYLFISKRNTFIVGIGVALCFLLRFPYGILFPLFGLLILVSGIVNRTRFKDVFVSALMYGLGFALIILPYLILNRVLYGSYLEPFIVGSQMITGSLWLYDQSVWFYTQKLFIDNPISLFSLVAIVSIGKRELSKEQKIFLVFLCAWVLIFLGYFTSNPHKEWRYIAPVLPALALLAGVGLFYSYRFLNKIFFILVVLAMSVYAFSHTTIYTATKVESGAYREFYNFLKTERNATVISDSPIITAYSPVRIIPAYDTWENFHRVYSESRDKADYILINTCELHVCVPGKEKECEAKRLNTLNEIEKRESIIYDKTEMSCRLIISKINKQ